MAALGKLSIYTQLLKTFEQQLLRYKSLVYEQYMTPLTRHEYGSAQTKENRPAILIIEDNADEGVLIRQALLRQFPHVDAVWVASAFEATAYFKQCINEGKDLPCVILIDLYLPTAKLGLGILKALKTHRLFQKIPLITLSRSNQAEDIVQAFNHSSDYYILKPANYADWPAAFSPLKNYLPACFLTA